MLSWPVYKKNYTFNTDVYQGKKKKFLQATFKNGKREKKNDHKKTDFRIVISDGNTSVI